MNSNITLRELVRRCKAVGLWHVNRYGQIRTIDNRCPLEVAAGVGANQITMATRMLGIDGYSHTMDAADNMLMDLTTERAKYIRRVLLKFLVRGE